MTIQVSLIYPIICLFLTLFVDKALVAIQELEGHLEDLDIQPMPEAQYLVYNRVPKVYLSFTHNVIIIYT